jgi:hypothetical protein
MDVRMCKYTIKVWIRNEYIIWMVGVTPVEGNLKGN